MGLLDGVRVLDLTRFLAGPYGSMMLADQGAAVVKVETPRGGDMTRAPGMTMLDGVNPFFLSVNRNKQSITLDLSTDAGREVFLRLSEHADVVYDNFRPGVMGRFGLDADTLRVRNPRLIVCSVSGFGHTGPASAQPAFDLIIQARGGTMSITGPVGGEPVPVGVSLGDMAGGMYAAFAIAAALHRRTVTGQGDTLDISLLDCQAAMLSYHFQNFIASGQVPELRGTRHHLVAPFQVFRTADGYVAVVAFQDRVWGALCTVLARPEWEHDERFDSVMARAVHKDALGDLLTPLFLEQPNAYWLERLRAVDIPCGPLHDMRQVSEDPQLRARGMVRELPHPDGGTYVGLGDPVRSVNEGESAFAPAPHLGAGTDAVLREWLGADETEVGRIRDSGACG